MPSPARQLKRQFWRRRCISLISVRCQIIFAVAAAIFVVQDAAMDRPPVDVRQGYLLAGGNPILQTQPGITKEEDEHIVSGPPGFVKVQNHGELHAISWQGTRDDTILGYQVYRRCQQEPWQPIGFVKLREDDPRNSGTYLYNDHFPENCEYTVAAVGPGGKPGPKSVDIQ